MNDHFSDDTDIGREDRDTAREILSGGLDHIEDTCKTILQEAKDTWGKLTGVKELQDYMERRKTQNANTSNEKGVDFVASGKGKTESTSAFPRTRIGIRISTKTTGELRLSANSTKSPKRKPLQRTTKAMTNRKLPSMRSKKPRRESSPSRE